MLAHRNLTSGKDSLPTIPLLRHELCWLIPLSLVLYIVDFFKDLWSWDYRMHFDKFPRLSQLRSAQVLRQYFSWISAPHVSIVSTDKDPALICNHNMSKSGEELAISTGCLICIVILSMVEKPHAEKPLKISNLCLIKVTCLTTIAKLSSSFSNS